MPQTIRTAAALLLGAALVGVALYVTVAPRSSITERDRSADEIQRRRPVAGTPERDMPRLIERAGSLSLSEDLPIEATPQTEGVLHVPTDAPDSPVSSGTQDTTQHTRADRTRESAPHDAASTRSVRIDTRSVWFPTWRPYHRGVAVREVGGDSVLYQPRARPFLAVQPRRLSVGLALGASGAGAYVSALPLRVRGLEIGYALWGTREPWTVRHGPLVGVEVHKRLDVLLGVSARDQYPLVGIGYRIGLP